MQTFSRRALLGFVGAVLFVGGCNRTPQSGTTNPPGTSAGQAAPTPQAQSSEVVVYCSVDDVYARPILRELEQKTGLWIRPLFDVEAAKTAGLASRLRAERKRPRADIFWSSALLQTLLLQREGLLEAYAPKGARDLPGGGKGVQWSATGVRARVIVYHASVKQPPISLDDLLSPRFKGKVGISNPLFGTGSDWVAALTTRRGKAATLKFFRDLKANGVQVLPGNSVVAERVARGELLAGVTDTDDFLALSKKFPTLQLALPATTRDAVVVPMNAALIKGAPHRKAAQKLLDALATAATEAHVVRAMPGVLPLRPKAAGAVPAAIKPLVKVAGTAPNDSARWAASWQSVRDEIADILLKN